MNDSLIIARLTGTLPGVDVPQAGTLPTEIQWMPPGRHKINAIKNDKPAELEVDVDEAAAGKIIEAFSRIQTRAAEGDGDLAFVDFNHKDAEAAGWVQSVRWAGDDPKTGGIRASIRWSEPGTVALKGKAYRRFSPSFYLSEDGDIIGCPENMGGLVNKAAFRKIEPIWSRGIDTTTRHRTDDNNKQTKDPDMSDEKLLADLKAEVATKDAQIAELKAKLDKNDNAKLVEAKDAEIKILKDAMSKAEAKLAENAKANAKALVEAAVKDGRLAPQATEVHAKWIELIAADPKNSALLDGVKPAAVVQALGTAITASTAAVTSNVTDNGKKDFPGLVTAHMAEKKVGKVAAIQAMIREHGDVYKAWRDSGGGNL